MSQSSISSVFINTFPKEQRVKMLKSKKELGLEPPNSTNIYKSNMLDYYTLRPDCLEDTCLADFMANYEFISNKNKLTKNLLSLKNNTGFLKKRKIPKIIRYRRYDILSDPQNFFRENCMLYFPWRDEEKELSIEVVEEKFNINFANIQINSEKYNSSAQLLDEIDSIKFEENTNTNFELTELYEDDINEFQIYRLNQEDTNIEMEMPMLHMNPEIVEHPTLSVMNSVEYEELMRSLNLEQRQFLVHIMSNVLYNTTFYHCAYGNFIYLFVKIKYEKIICCRKCWNW